MSKSRRDSLEHKSKRSSRSAADKIVASTAGKDTWKTYAGRNHGTDQFEILDLFRGMKRSFHNQFLAGPPTTGTACPVCLCEPDNAGDWHVTWCGHSVCKDCLQQYASSQVKDKEYNGLLKCPVCNQELRRKDALVAFGENVELIRTWDTKIRNQLLRALPNYRPCPKCSNHRSDANEDHYSKFECGGGFVTPECLKPHYDERRDLATETLKGRQFVLVALVVVYFSMVSIIANNPSKSASVDLFFMMVLIYPCFKAGILARYCVAEVARQTFFKPITVECPCCNEAFVLPAESTVLYEDESYRWMDANTRQCPSCSVKIVKSGGCNHIRCSRCQADFCWACMRLRTNCRAYRCVNGAKYGNAVPTLGQGESRAPGANDSILTVIDYLLRRPKPNLGYFDLLILFACFFSRNLDIVRSLVGSLLEVLSSVFISQVLLGALVLAIVGKVSQDMSNYLQQQLHRQQQQGHPFTTVRALQQRMEQEMIDEAVRRSMQDL